MKITIETRPYVIGALGYISHEKAKEVALKYFRETYMDLYVDIPIISDARGETKFARYRITDFLVSNDPAQRSIE